MFSFIRFSFAVLCAGLFLTACGGGGGDGSSMPIRDTMPPLQPPPMQTTQSAFGESGDRPTLTPLQSRNQITGTLRQSDPAFGSVAMNLYTPGLAPVRSAETTFTGDRFTLSVRRQNGSGFTLDTNRHYTEIVNDSSLSINPVTRRPFASGYMGDISGNRAVVAGALVEWSNADYTDYLAGGYWLVVDGGLPAVEMGAFIHGADYTLNTSMDLPVTGTATYRGRAGGLYVAASGTDSLSPGAASVGEYEGRVRLTADFGTMQMQGRVDNIAVTYEAGQHANGVPYEVTSPQASDVEMVFNPVPITQAGVFQGDNVEFVSNLYQITSSAGSWAGQFSNVADHQGNPRAAAGTNTGYLETVGGSRAFLTGAFYGATERFE